MTRTDKLHRARHRILDVKDERGYLTLHERRQLDAILSKLERDDMRRLAWSRRQWSDWDRRLDEIGRRILEAVEPKGPMQ